MRPIKFRYLYNGSWHYIDFSTDNTGLCFKEYENRKTHSPLLQFTGLTDRNGKEVYEGDVVEKSGKKYVIRWNQLHVCWGLFHNNFQSKEEIMCDIADCKGNAPKEWTDTTLNVIGNIYETKNQSK